MLARELPLMAPANGCVRDRLTRCWRQKYDIPLGSSEEPQCEHTSSPDKHDLGQCSYHAEQLRRSMQ